MTVKKLDENRLEELKDFGAFVAECLPKYIQKVQIVTADELEFLIEPNGVLPTLAFLKDHHNCQYTILSDLTAVDVPSRTYRFEARFQLHLNQQNS